MIGKSDSPPKEQEPTNQAQHLMVGQKVISPQYVFIQRKYVFAMVCPKPVTDGHVLVYPTRSKATCLQDLSELEVLELFVCA